MVFLNINKKVSSYGMLGKKHSKKSKIKTRNSVKKYWDNLSKEKIISRNNKIKNILNSDIFRKISSDRTKLQFINGMPKETKEKLRRLNKGKHNSPLTEFKKGMIPWIKGKHHSENTKKIMKKAKENIVTPKKDTRIELKVQRLLTKLHIEYITHKYISEITHSYQCDIFIPVQEGILKKTIIECDGCFYHCCPICKNKTYEFTEKRRELDRIRTKELIEKGFKVIRLWEHEIKPITIKEFVRRLI